jgi:hypothetical protein
MRLRKKREHYWDGFRDGLVHGHQNPYPRESAEAREIYDRGIRDAERAIDRIVALATNGKPKQRLKR